MFACCMVGDTSRSCSSHHDGAEPFRGLRLACLDKLAVEAVDSRLCAGAIKAALMIHPRSSPIGAELCWEAQNNGMRLH